MAFNKFAFCITFFSKTFIKSKSIFLGVQSVHSFEIFASTSKEKIVLKFPSVIFLFILSK
jgi:hypothetical protein